MASFLEKKKKIVKKVISVMDILDPTKTNSIRYNKFLNNMNEKDFKQYITYLKDGKVQIYIVIPNMELQVNTNDLLKAADVVNLNLFQRIWLYDEESKTKYLTNKKYVILKLPIRRMQQFLDNKLKVPTNNTKTDGISGQLRDTKASLSTQESQILHNKGLDNVLVEMLKVRGGASEDYAIFNQQLEETGKFELDKIDLDMNRAKSARSVNTLLTCMHFKSNL